MGHKNPKGSITIQNYKNRIRLRWRYQSKRYSINLSSYNKLNLLKARKIVIQIEQDIAIDAFDFSLMRYRSELGRTAKETKTIVELFEKWVSEYKQMDCEKHINYFSVRNMLKKWGIIEQHNILAKLNAEIFNGTTYNRRLTMLKSFADWLVKNKVWRDNPLKDVSKKKHKKVKSSKRMPVSEGEITSILNALKNNTFSSKYSLTKHSHYYPFVYFLFKTGVRNAEAIGLRIESIDVVKKRIIIKEVLARSLKSTSSVSRIRKETKNGKERFLPLTQDLFDVLKPIIKGRNKESLVFLSPTGKAIDDNNFQKRIFKKVLKKLNIEERVIYTARHTFNSRCIDSGITPVMTAFLMGNNPETALRNYTHQLNVPTELPNI